MSHFDVVVVGGGPSGSIAAEALAKDGFDVLLVDPNRRIKPCGGAIPSRTMKDFNVDAGQLVARANAARIISPSQKKVSMEIGDIGYVGMVDREHFDPYLRQRAAEAGAHFRKTKLQDIIDLRDGRIGLKFSDDKESDASASGNVVTCNALIGADGANSTVRRHFFDKKKWPPYVFAYHEVIESPDSFDEEAYRPDRCEVIYDGGVSPDFYGWVFPHGKSTSVGCGSAHKGHSLRQATQVLRERAGLKDCKTLRTEGAPLPLRPMRRWDNGRNVLLIGDAAGTVAPCSGEGIYYGMLTGQLGAQAVAHYLRTGQSKALKSARKSFMKAHGTPFFVLRVMQAIWYHTDKRREQFVKMCQDPDVQKLTWESYLNKKLSRRDPMAHVRVFWKDMQQLLGVAR